MIFAENQLELQFKLVEALCTDLKLPMAFFARTNLHLQVWDDKMLKKILVKCIGHLFTENADEQYRYLRICEEFQLDPQLYLSDFIDKISSYLDSLPEAEFQYLKHDLLGACSDCNERVKFISENYQVVSKES